MKKSLMKKTGCAVITTVLIIIMFQFSYAYGTYYDLPDTHWAYRYVEEMSNKGILAGFSDGSFKPQKKVTCAEFLKMVYVASTGNTAEQPAGTHWAENYYRDSIKTGIVKEKDMSYRELDDVISRGLMACIIYNCLSPDEIKEAKTEAGFIDIDGNTEYVREIKKVCSMEILNGYPDRSFKPEEGLTRAEAAAAVYRMMNKTESGAGEKDSAADFIEKKTIGSGNSAYEIEKYSADIGFNGIDKIVYAEKSGCIGVYSKKIQDISLFIDDYRTNPVVNPEGEYWKEGDYYVYVFKSDGKIKAGSQIGLSFGLYIDEVFYYRDIEI